MPLLFTSEGFVMKSFDVPKSLGARNNHDVFPLFISLQDFRGYPGKSPNEIAVFKYLPHVVNVLYYIRYVKGVSAALACHA